MRTVPKLLGTVGAWTGSASAIFLALLAVALWTVVGLRFGFTESLLLAAGTGTTLVTFVMVFVIQHAQNRDSRAIQLKLDELIRVSESASNRLIHVQQSADEELESLEEQSRQLWKLHQEEQEK
jgi:low affinity Fe/Cu permease